MVLLSGHNVLGHFCQLSCSIDKLLMEEALCKTNIFNIFNSKHSGITCNAVTPPTINHLSVIEMENKGPNCMLSSVYIRCFQLHPNHV